MKPRLSIIIPVLNEALAIASVLEACAALRQAGAELIIVDGGSEDATRALCAGQADLVLQSPRGRARQMNAGAAAASGQVLLFLHADTALPPGALSAVLAALASGAHGWGRFDLRITGHARLFPLIGACINLRSRLTGIATGDQAIFVRRAVFAQVGGFPEQPLMEDIEFSTRMRRHGPPACLRLQVATSGRRWERDGVWRTILLMWRLRLLYWLGVPAQRLALAYR